MSKTEMAVNIGVAKSTLYLWIKAHEEFSDAINRAEEAAEAWYFKTFRALGTGAIEKGNPTSLIYASKNQLPHAFRDQHEYKVDGEVGLFQIDYLGYRDEDPEDSPEEA